MQHQGGATRLYWTTGWRARIGWRSLYARFTPEEPYATSEINLDMDDSRVAILDEDSEVVKEARVQNASFEQIAEEYAASKAAIEATSNYYTIYDSLDEYLDVFVADSTQTKTIGYAEVKMTGSMRSCRRSFVELA